VVEGEDVVVCCVCVCVVVVVVVVCVFVLALSVMTTSVGEDGLSTCMADMTVW